MASAGGGGLPPTTAIVGSGVNQDPLPVPNDSGDCMACRVIGSGGSGLAAAYLFWERTKVPVTAKAHRLALLTMATSFAALSVYRATL